MIILETERLTLRQMTPADAAFMLQLLNEPSFIENIGDKGVRTLEDAHHYILTGPVEMYRRHGFGLYRVDLKDTATPIGMCGLLKRDTLEHVDIGYAFLPKYWSKGYALEAARAVMAYGKDTLDLDRIVAIVSPHNEGSIKLLQKIGMKFEKMLRLTPADKEIKLFTSA
jgi:RimJ/RimL family protein N-acetyltransferase